ncbi:SDR family oxidoreductase [Phycicoccus endophyticus]|uniref:SDR family oxidoreductase n=1 Tax=Phycicoccus endophyticus TaxID=1690220 RepID=A0A7G9R4R7_9MICO|nr:SDR family oxidoreductase [Phycicoccus endophyticus]NHI18509.1 SDR family oxidoreductase [Phycicoccus endophyticus]QNN50592.1 SDR family oxidoreductase [Phycicoccus endophyticus]GGL23192.1 dehydrogenase [Phycicoccus endophyticus]
MSTPADGPMPDGPPPQEQRWPGSEAALDPPADHGVDSWVGRERLAGRRALVTGGDSGIGRAVALVFAREGADVLVAHLPEEAEDARVTAELVAAEGRLAVLHETDLRTHDAVRELAERARTDLGGVDVLVSNAAYQMTHDRLEDFPPEQVERTFATNVFATFWLVRELVGDLESSGGNVLVTTSVQAYEPADHLLDYAASKSALTNLTVNLAQELGPRGIRVNAVAPGPIWTPLIPATMSAEKVESFGTTTPLGRPGQPVEVAAAFLFLASDEARYVSGSVLGVTGGKPVF